MKRLQKSISVLLYLPFLLFLCINLAYSQWAHGMGGEYSYDDANSIAVDSNGNVYVTGRFHGTADFDPGEGTVNLTSNEGGNIFFAKYSPSGELNWAKNVGGTNTNYAYSIAVDASGNVYIMGDFSGTADFDPGEGTANLTSNNQNQYDFFFAKYSPSGELIWANSVGSTMNDQGRGIVVDSSGNVYVTGAFWGTADFDPGEGTANLTSNGQYDFFFAKYSPSGELTWAKNVGGTNTDYAYSIAVDASGNVYVTGDFFETADFDPGEGTTNLTANGGYDMFFAKYSSNGELTWAKNVGGGDGEGSRSIAVDASDNVYVTGYFYGTADFDPGGGITNLLSNGGQDFFFAKYTSSGELIWAKSTGGESVNDKGRSIAVDASGSVYVSGTFGETADFDPGEGTTNLTSNGQYDFFFAKYNSFGTLDIMGCTDLEAFNYNPEATVDDGSCLYGDFFLEDFNHDGNPPEGWMIEEPWQMAGGDAGNWELGISGEFTSEVHSIATSPVIDCRYYSDVGIFLLNAYNDETTINDNSEHGGFIEYSINGDENWEGHQLYHLEGTQSETSLNIMIPDACASVDMQNQDETIQVRFRFDKEIFNNEDYWEIDNVVFYGTFTDSLPPTDIVDLTAENFGASDDMTLTWSPPEEDNFSHYNIYYDTSFEVDGDSPVWTNGNDPTLSQLSTSSSLITGLEEYSIYWFKMQSYDTYGYASNLSNVASDTVNAEYNAPIISNPIPAQPPEWSNTNSIQIGCTIIDEGIGVDASTIQYRIDYDGDGTYDDSPEESWISYEEVEDGNDIMCSVDVSYDENLDSDDFRFEWQAMDIWGSGPSYSGNNNEEGIVDDWKVKIDITPPTGGMEILALPQDNTTIMVGWTPTSSDSFFETYQIYYSNYPTVDENDNLWDAYNDPTLNNSETTLTTISGLAQYSNYYFVMTAVDSAGNVGSMSNVLGPVHTDYSEGVNHALEFAGNDQSYVNLGSDQILHPETYTISTWVKVNGNSAGNNNAGIVSRLGSGAGAQYGYLLAITFSDPEYENHILFSAQDNSVNYYTHYSDYAIEFGSWYHVAATYDGEMANLYINGVKQGLGTEMPDLNNNNGFNTIIGKWRHDPGENNNFPLAGSVDEVAIWHQALSQEAIQAYMFAPLNGNEESLVGYWNFNEGEGGTLYDLSENDFDGIINGTTEWVDADWHDYPSLPQNLSAESGPGQIRLTWDLGSEADLEKYYIYRDSQPNPTTLLDSIAVPEWYDGDDGNRGEPSGILFIDWFPSGSSPYYYRLTAVDSDGNESAFSQEASAVRGSGTLHVSENEGSSDQNGTAETPLDLIQSALDLAIEGDTILVEAGEYVENIIWPATNGIKLIGEDRETTTIDGNQQGTVVTIDSGQDLTTVISEFTITNGYSDQGGGISIISSGIELSNLKIKNNESTSSGGGIYCKENCNGLGTDLEIGWNEARFGGGMMIDNSNLELNNVIIYNNSSERGGGVYCEGGASLSLYQGLIVKNESLIEIMNSENSCFMF